MNARCDHAVAESGLPRAVAPFCRSLGVAGPEPAGEPITAASLAAALARFGARFACPDRAALGSLWSLYYFNAVLIPAAVELLCRDRILPVALAATTLAIAADGSPERIIIPARGRPTTEADFGRRFTTICDEQIAALVPLLVETSGVTPRVLWCNAGTVLDWTLGATAAAALPDPRSELEALLAGTARASKSARALASPLRDTAHGERERRVCCTRYRLPGVAACLPICPARAAALRPAQRAGAERARPVSGG